MNFLYGAEGSHFPLVAVEMRYPEPENEIIWYTSSLWNGFSFCTVEDMEGIKLFVAYSLYVLVISVLFRLIKAVKTHN